MEHTTPAAWDRLRAFFTPPWCEAAAFNFWLLEALRSRWEGRVSVQSSVWTLWFAGAGATPYLARERVEVDWQHEHSRVRVQLVRDVARRSLEERGGRLTVTGDFASKGNAVAVVESFLHQLTDDNATISVRDDETIPEPLLSCLDWYDRPVFGVASAWGIPHYFQCEFSQTHDEYGSEYVLWPVPGDVLVLERRAHELFTAYRASFDRGEGPAPIWNDPTFAALGSSLEDARHPPLAARRATAEWFLDSDRSFATKQPIDSVRWAEVAPRDP